MLLTFLLCMSCYLCTLFCVGRGTRYNPVPMDHLSLQCDGKTDTPGSSLMGKDVSDACFDFLLSTSADYFKSYG